MARPEIDISLDGVGQDRVARSASSRGLRSRIDIPLEPRKVPSGKEAEISDRELEFVNRHHQKFMEQRRRAREET